MRSLSRFTVLPSLLLGLALGCTGLEPPTEDDDPPPGDPGGVDRPEGPDGDIASSTVYGRALAAPDGEARQMAVAGPDGCDDGDSCCRLGCDGMPGGESGVVLALEVLADAALRVVGHAAIDAAGSFTLRVPAHARGLILVALDVDGEIIAEAVLALAAEVDGAVHTVLDLETTLEAEVFLRLVAGGTSPKDTDLLDLHARITAEIALAVMASARAAATLAIDVTAHIAAQIHALAEACAAAQVTHLRVLADAGVDLDSDLDLCIDVLRAYHSARYDGKDPAELLPRFLADLDLCLRASIDLDIHARARLAASLAFSAVIKAMIDLTATVNASLAASVAATVYACVAASTRVLLDLGASIDLIASLGVHADIHATIDACVRVLVRLVAYPGVEIDLAIRAALRLAVEIAVRVRLDLDAKVRALVVAGAWLDLKAVAALSLCAALDLEAEVHARVAASLRLLLGVKADAAAKVLFLLEGARITGK
jgi:hypothetical protein